MWMCGKDGCLVGMLLVSVHLQHCMTCVNTHEAVYDYMLVCNYIDSNVCECVMEIYSQATTNSIFARMIQM